MVHNLLTLKSIIFSSSCHWQQNIFIKVYLINPPLSKRLRQWYLIVGLKTNRVPEINFKNILLVTIIMSAGWSGAMLTL